jgi:nucleoside-diphosphate-sugar epimerase
VPSDRTPSVAVVGAAGLVGRALLRHLEELEIRATAIVRGPPELAVDGDFHAISSAPAEVARDGFDVVINLAYPTSGQGYEYPGQDREIARTVETLSRNGARLIHVSTLAVFGLALDRPVKLGPVAVARDNAYVESKISAEQSFIEQQADRGLSLDVVRLGNVWGHASGTWTLPIVHRLITGRFVGVAGMPSYSNTTDVANVAAYLAFLVQAGECRAGVRFHHLAEFSGVTWPEWIEPIAAAIGVEPVYAERSVLETPASGVQEISAALAPLKPRSLYRTLSAERVMGSRARSLVRQFPAPIRARLKSDGLIFAADPQHSREEQTFLAIMAGTQEFESRAHPDWTTCLTKAQSLERVLRWVEGAPAP